MSGPSPSHYGHHHSHRWAYHHPYYPYSSFYRPFLASRLLWFALGAASATLFIWHKEAHHARNSRYWGNCFRAPVQVPGHIGGLGGAALNEVLPSGMSPGASNVNKDACSTWARAPKTANNEKPTATPNPPPPLPAPVPWGFESFEQQRIQWEQDRERLIAKAQDAMTELSEATLDSIASTVESLKAKLAEHRAQREKQQRLIEEQQAELDKAKQDPVRYV
ncbi:hypothetical protein D9758_005980 [Tetrapyrgos nigripes]|uniref:Transmembrane protein n=1 Tax=Tetrapyrgos nigripes TaxID=182062 RepID=A0A8H5G0E3_9AGAR|nr:hypothetical protein D9758_005980 [Tetrapyrgos nigripes]